MAPPDFANEHSQHAKTTGARIMARRGASPYARPREHRRPPPSLPAPEQSSEPGSRTAAGDVDFLRRTIPVRQHQQGETNPTTELVAPEFGSERVVYAPADLIALFAPSTFGELVSGQGNGSSRPADCR